jgi:hypothetical protein
VPGAAQLKPYVRKTLDTSQGSVVASADSLADFLPVNRDRLVERDIKAACDKSGRTSLRAAVRGTWAGHRRDTGRPQKTKPLKFLALPRGLEPLFSP